MHYVGIDPGKSGAVCVFDADAKALAIQTTPTLMTAKGKREYDVARMVMMLRERPASQIAQVTIERTSTRPGEGVVSAHAIGWGAGLWVGIVAALGLPYHLVWPMTWRSALLAGMPKAETPKERKAQAGIVAGQLFPSAPLRGPKGALLDGHADALLIMEYGRRMMRTNEPSPFANREPRT